MSQYVPLISFSVVFLTQVSQYVPLISFSVVFPRMNYTEQMCLIYSIYKGWLFLRYVIIYIYLCLRHPYFHLMFTVIRLTSELTVSDNLMSLKLHL